MKRKIYTLCLSLLLVTFWTSCKKDALVNDNPPATALISATSLGTYTKAQLTHRADSAGFGAFSSLIKYDVTYYKIIYRIKYKNGSLQVSGLLGIPQDVPKTPSLLCAQHGTMFRNADAPSNFPKSFNGFPLLASVGYVTLVPDFIGLGTSNSVPQAYYDQQYSGRTVVDMIKAVQEFLQQQQISVSDRLFLLGYSEGGYVTMAAQKEIETNPEIDWKITAAAEGAGGYDLTRFLSQVVQAATYKAPSFLALIISSYNDLYNWNRPFSDYFNEPYASTIPALLDGHKTRAQIDAALPQALADLFNPSFFSSLQDPGNQTPFKLKLSENSFLSWVPKSPTRLFHGTSDHLVPFETTQATYDRFEAAGATNVELFPIQGGTHETSVLPMMASALPWFASLDK